MVVAKKGIGHYGKDPTRMIERIGCSWYYNWTPYPSKGRIGAEFIPMFWSGHFVTRKNMEHVKKAGYSALLGFNEPDGHGQADMTVAAAIRLWPRLMETGLRLGSPATTTGAPWLDRFMDKARQKNLAVDIICLHWYRDITRPKAVDAFHRYLEGYWKKYRRPIWMTEYSGANFDWHLRKATFRDNARFARDTIKLMDSLPYVERYAWFTDWPGYDDKVYPTVGLYKKNLKTLSPVGISYRDTR